MFQQEKVQSRRVLIFYKMGAVNVGGFTEQPKSQASGRIDMVMNVTEPNFKGRREKQFLC